MDWGTIIKESKDVVLVENSIPRIRATLNLMNVVAVVTDEYELENVLLNYKFNTIWLDYDLTRIFKPFHRQTSLNVIKTYKRALQNAGCKLIVIHSWNPFGRKRLYNELRDLGIKIVIKRHWRIF